MQLDSKHALERENDRNTDIHPDPSGHTVADRPEPEENHIMKMFRDLTEAEVLTFRAWADDEYVPGEVISPIWHPVVQARCAEINKAYNADPGLQDIAIEMRYV